MKDSSAWSKLHEHYEKEDWINKPNIFAQEALKSFPNEGRVLDLGAGQGQDSRLFASEGYKVHSTDISEKALELNKTNLDNNLANQVKIKELDLTQPFPYEDNLFDVVYAHLSLHYFDQETTEQIFQKIRRVLKPGGIFAALVNSVNDPELNTGKRLEQELFEIEGKTKRFFSIYSMDYFAHKFQIILLDDKGKTYKDEAKGVHNLVRFIGRNFPRRDENFALPFVAAIIERERYDETEVLIQTRWKPHSDSGYHNTIEIPAGVLDKPYENILDTLKREVKEETGLTVTKIKNLRHSSTYSPQDDGAFAFQPFCGAQQLKGGLPWIGFVFVCEVEDSEPQHQETETRNIRWIKKSELREQFEQNSEEFFTLHLGSLEIYLQAR